jgi:hypothetical protein
MIRRPRIAPSLLPCVECVQLSEGRAHGWRAYLVGGLDGEPLAVVVLCPGCVEREQLER